MVTKELLEKLNTNLTCTLEEFIDILIEEKAKTEELSWEDVSNLVAKAFDFKRDRRWWSRNYQDTYLAYKVGNELETASELNHEADREDATLEDIKSTIVELQKERTKLSDEKSQYRSYIRKIARDEVSADIAYKAAEIVAKQKPLYFTPYPYSSTGCNEGILLLSDWHYGLEVDSGYNVYNSDIAKQRVSKLCTDVIYQGVIHKVKKLHIFNLGDLISGRIHLTVRLESREDVISQIIGVSELLAEALNKLSENFEIEYYSCIDNHSRIEPTKDDSLDSESFCRLIDWYLKARLSFNTHVHFNKNDYSEDIIATNILGHDVCAVHGDNDKPKSVIASLNSFLGKHFDMIAMAHRHHFSADEECETLLICNSSLCGTDTYSAKLRLRSQPSQTLIIATEENVASNILRIML